MSVVTRWRSTFSSSVTHFTAMSGFLAVKSFVSPCILIMSLLFTVAIVSVVCAIEGAQTKRLAAPSRAPRTCFTVTSLNGAEHMPTPCNYVHTEFSALSRIGWRRQQLLVAADAKEAPPARESGIGCPEISSARKPPGYGLRMVPAVA